jgi:SAM-dependent methyltransferase
MTKIADQTNEISLGEELSSKKQAGCRFCGTPLEHTFVDLGMSPLCQSFVSADHLNHTEPFYPLNVYVCGKCFLVQLQEYVAPQNIFSDYLYFASYSDTWLAHVKAYTDKMVQRFPINENSLVVEIASNDGYLLQYFVQKRVPVLGIEPAANVAAVAMQKGIPSLVKFFNSDTARELVAKGQRADLLLGNNVLAHVPDINNFVAGMKILLKPAGVITMEFPHLMRLMEENQFDTIYHEHFSYLSFCTVEKIFAAHGLTLFDVEELPTHGGSLRIYARHEDDKAKPVEPSVTELRAREQAAGFGKLETYSRFAEQVKETKRKLLEFLIRAKQNGKTIVGYGAPGKGNTLLNYCGIRTDFIDYTVDRSPHKQGMFLPGTRIPVFSPDRIRETRPDYLLILPWNLKDEIMRQNSYIREWGGQFVVPIPEVAVFQ